MNQNPYPQLNDRAQGWLKHLWRKATTPDDWSINGEPHPWWDQYSTPPMASFPRFDLADSSYAMAAMADKTPAWREVYTRILGELVERHTSHWAFVDWLTQIGPDPRRKEYPDEWNEWLIPQHLVGEYDVPGWTANGVEPWGLQPDPLAAEGALWIKGWFNLIMALYEYVSGDQKWHQPFQISGYEDKKFEWTQPRVAETLATLCNKHPEGLHCENTKVWPVCMSSAGLGLHLSDTLTTQRNHWVYSDWVEYAKKHYIHYKNGELDWLTMYYDPLIDYHHQAGKVGFAGLMTIWYLLPQKPELASMLYEFAIAEMGWNNPAATVPEVPDPRLWILGYCLANELGDNLVAARLHDAFRKSAGPRFFGEGEEEFGFFFEYGEQWPRGQLSALLMMTEVGGVGAWSDIYNRPNLTKFAEPTVEGVEFPALSIAQAYNDLQHGMLQVSTAAASSSRRGEATSYRVTNLPDPDAIIVRCDGNEFAKWRKLDPATIEIMTDIDDHSFQIFTGYYASEDVRSSTEGASRQQQDSSTLRTDSPIVMRSQTMNAAARSVFSGGLSCPCCPA